MAKKKIAILGGGMAALAAALELTSRPDWREHYEIDLYQLGWRLGGKTATGRGPNDRIEEHGIHILQGWYATTFQLLREVYAEREAAGLDPDSPLQDLFGDGLERNNTTLMTERDPVDGKWYSWPLILPETENLPGTGEPLPTWALMQKGLAMALEFVLGSPYQRGEGPIDRLILDHFFPGSGGQPPSGCLGVVATPLAWLGKRVAGDLPAEIEALRKAKDLAHSAPLAGDDHHDHHRRIHGHLGTFLRGVEGKIVAGVRKGGRLRRILIALNFGYYLLKGVLEDVYRPETDTFDYAAIDGYDFREWLRRLGAPEWLVESVIVRFFYTGTFANLVTPDGGSLSASTALQFLVHSIGYQGSFVFQFQYGTGDTMVMPVYQVLKHRGVNFHFFQRVTGVVPGDDGRIARVEIQEQVRLLGETYDPARVLTDGLSAWPAEPLYDQLDPVQAEELQRRGIDLEDPWANWQGAGNRNLEVGTDFDEVILGIPIGCLPHICGAIIEENEAWQRMVREVKTTPTQSAQLWLYPTLDELGFKLADWGLPERFGAPNVVVYENPMYSWLDSSLVLPHENWPADNRPAYLAYYTGPYVLPAGLPPYTDHNYPRQQLGLVRQEFSAWLGRNMAFFWPGGAASSDPAGLNFELLWSADPEASPEERYAQQYFRVNVRPTDHYTLSVPGSSAYRLKTDASGYVNLYLCGDWIDFGVNVGYIDGAIQSGQQAGRALRTGSGPSRSTPHPRPRPE